MIQIGQIKIDQSIDRRAVEQAQGLRDDDRRGDGADEGGADGLACQQGHAALVESASEQLGLRLRAGLHTGEIELRDSDIGGIAVHAAARVMAQCQPSEVLVSRVVTDLVAGAGLKFSERGSYELKGIPGRWDLFSAIA